jgi:hypothetical protein
MHIYASAFSRRDRSRRAWRRRRVAMLPALFGALTGLVLLGIVEVAPVIVGAIL